VKSSALIYHDVRLQGLHIVSSSSMTSSCMLEHGLGRLSYVNDPQ
jgi:hypothetical protein